MQVPAAAFIETAVDMLAKVSQETKDDQTKELVVATGKRSEEYAEGYNLGLQTARVMILLNQGLNAVLVRYSSSSFKAEDIL